jgi:hypothetical protein
MAIAIVASLKSCFKTEALTFSIPSGMLYFLWFPIILGRGNSNDLYFTFFIIITVDPQVREPTWWFCQELSMSVPSMVPRIGNITRGWVQGHNHPPKD